MAIFDEPSRKPLPTTPEIGDHRTAVIKGALGNIPILGGALVEELGLLLAPPLARRRDEWLEDLARRLHDIEGTVAGFHFDDLSQNEQFVSATLQATQAALRTHQKEKLEALRNAVLHVASGDAPNENRQTVFLSLIDRFTPVHIDLLKGFKDSTVPRVGTGAYLQWQMMHSNQARQAGRSKEDSQLVLWVRDSVPALANESEHFIRMLISDLYSSALIAIAPTDGQIPSALEESVTPLGKEFLEFIATPHTGDAHD